MSDRRTSLRQSLRTGLSIACSALLVAGLAGNAGAASFQGLGDLPGGIFESVAFDVSSDGSTIVGRGTSASGDEAFIWDTSMVCAVCKAC